VIVPSSETHRRVVGFVNASSGKNSDNHEIILEALQDAGVELRELDVNRVSELIADAVREGAEAVVVVGGDGTQQAAAATLADSDVPLIPVPAGTWNHLAKTLGITNVDDAVVTLEHGELATFPLGAVNGRFFVNTAVVGWYPDLVRTREKLRKRWPRPVAASIAVLRHVAKLQRFAVTIDHERYETWMVWVGNGEYGDEVSNLTDRRWSNNPKLDVRVALADNRLPKLGLLIDLLRGRLRQGNHLKMFHPTPSTTLTVHASRRRIDVALDGEVVVMRSPLQFTTGTSVRVLTPRTSVA
jgi:diacylglycerol kinase family enzyme